MIRFDFLFCRRTALCIERRRGESITCIIASVEW
jgi:hypothetical protein